MQRRVVPVGNIEESHLAVTRALKNRDRAPEGLHVAGDHERFVGENSSDDEDHAHVAPVFFADKRIELKAAPARVARWRIPAIALHAERRVLRSD